MNDYYMLLALILFVYVVVTAETRRKYKLFK